MGLSPLFPSSVIDGLGRIIVFNSCRHVWYYRRLRSCHCSAHRKRYGPSAVTELQLIYRLHAPRQWVERWWRWIGSGLCNRYRRGSGRKVIYAAVTSVRRNGPDTHLWRGPWLVRVDCRPDPEFKELRLKREQRTNFSRTQERASFVGPPWRAYLQSSVLVNVYNKSRLPTSAPRVV